MSIEAWPFIVASSPHNEYRAIVAPEFLCERGAEQLLKVATGAYVTGWSTGIMKKISRLGDLQLGSLLVIFRSVEPPREELGISENSRREKITEGFVVRDESARRIENGSAGELSAEHFDQVRQMYLPTYQEFWHDRQPQPPTVASKSIFLTPAMTGTPMRLKREADFSADGIVVKKNPKGFRSPIQSVGDREKPADEIQPTKIIGGQVAVMPVPDERGGMAAPAPENRPILWLAFGLGVAFGLSLAFIVDSVLSFCRTR